MVLLALYLSKELAVAANTIISSSLHNEVMLANHKAASSLYRSCVMPGAEFVIQLPHSKGCSMIPSHGVTKEFVILKQLPQMRSLCCTL